MCKAGDAVKSANGSSSEKEIIEDAPCIVKFRPCKDWRGEYGFDWVREGEEDYKERIQIRSNKVGLGESLIEDLEEYGDFRTAALRNCMGEEEYAKWRRLQYTNWCKSGLREEWPNYFHERSMEKVLELGKTNNLGEYYDNELWKKLSKGQDKFDESKQENAKADTPLAYVYPPKFVDKVVYTCKRAHQGSFWISEVHNIDDANGEKSIVRGDCPPVKANCFIKTDKGKDHDGKEPIVYSNNSFFIPIYREKPWTVLPPLNQKQVDGKPEWLSDSYYSKYSGSWKKVSFTNKKKRLRYKLSYHNKEGCNILVADIVRNPPKDESNDKVKKFCYLNGELQWVQVYGGWHHISKLKERKRRQVEKSADKVITNEIKCNENMTIDELVKNKDYDEIEVALYGYQDRIEQVGISVDFDQKTSRYKWTEKDLEIVPWDKHYIKSFEPLVLKKDNKIIEDAYPVPVLSISTFKKVRTRFIFRSLYDAPDTESCKVNEYDLSIRVTDLDKQKVEKIVLESENSCVSIEPKEIGINELDEENRHGITVKYDGAEDINEQKTFYVSAKWVAKESNDNPKLAGRFKVVLNKKIDLPIAIIYVHVEGKDFGTKLKQSVKNELRFMETALFSAGIVPNYKEHEISLTAESIKDSEKNGKYDPLEDDVFFNKLWEVKGVDFSKMYIMFVFDEVLSYPNYVAYASEYEWKGKNYHYSFFFRQLSFLASYTHTFAHELFHSLGLPHQFQLDITDKPMPFCFPIGSSSNIMDYYDLQYSLHQFQLKTIISEAKRYTPKKSKKKKNRKEK